MGLFYEKALFIHTMLSNIYTQTKVKQQSICFKHKKMFRTKIWEIQVLLSSFDFTRIEYKCN